MNLLTPVSELMSKKLITVGSDDSLFTVKEKFDQHNIHHLPVVEAEKIVGIISNTDLNIFLSWSTLEKGASELERTRLEVWRAAEIMTKGLAKVESSDPLRTVIEVFKLNRFHALPVVDQGKLVGIITTHDIIKLISEEPILLKDYRR